jgi:hypothetical protein
MLLFAFFFYSIYIMTHLQRCKEYDSTITIAIVIYCHRRHTDNPRYYIYSRFKLYYYSCTVFVIAAIIICCIVAVIIIITITVSGVSTVIATIIINVIIIYYYYYYYITTLVNIIPQLYDTTAITIIT